MKRWISLILILIMLLGMNTVSFAQGEVILALGDSISAGYGLDDRAQECFVSLFAREGDIVINKAVDGNEATHIIDQLTNTDNENYISPSDIENADTVTITCGGNDMMELLYEKIAAEYTNVHPRKQKIAPDEVLGKMAAGNVYAIAAALHVLDCKHEAYYMNDGQFDTRLDAFTENLLQITDYIKSINPNARIMVATQYNPYVEFIHSATLNVLYHGMEEGATRLNEAIRENARMGGYEVCDVKSTFDSYTGYEDLYNAEPDLDNINLDFHPSAAGHQLIACAFARSVYNLHFLGFKGKGGTYTLPKEAIGYYITDTLGNTKFVNAGIYSAQEGDIAEEVYMNVALVDGAQVRISKGSGLRFIATVDRSGFDGSGYGIRLTCEDGEEELFIDAETWQSDTCFTVAIENIAKENYIRNYTAAPFIRVVYDDGEEAIILSGKSVTRSIYSVAKGLLDSGKALDENTKKVLEEYVG